MKKFYLCGLLSVILMTMISGCFKKPIEHPVDYKTFYMKKSRAKDGTLFMNGGTMHFKGKGKLRYRWASGPAWMNGTYKQTGESVVVDLPTQDYKGVGGRFTFNKIEAKFKAMGCAIALVEARRLKSEKWGDWQSNGFLFEQKKPKCVASK